MRPKRLGGDAHAFFFTLLLYLRYYEMEIVSSFCLFVSSPCLLATGDTRHTPVVVGNAG